MQIYETFNPQYTMNNNVIEKKKKGLGGSNKKKTIEILSELWVWCLVQCGMNFSLDKLDF